MGGGQNWVPLGEGWMLTGKGPGCPWGAGIFCLEPDGGFLVQNHRTSTYDMYILCLCLRLRHPSIKQ